MYKLFIFLSLAFCWLILSGEEKFIIPGVISVLLTMLLTYRLKILDSQNFRHYSYYRLFDFFYWLIKEIFNSTMQVVSLIWKADLAVRPHHGWIDMKLDDNISRAIYANAITLTPGTITVQVEQGRLYVHCLQKRGLDDLLSGSMENKVSKIHGAKK